jgi:hypothetical protein
VVARKVEWYAAQQLNVAKTSYPPNPIQGEAKFYIGAYSGKCNLGVNPPPSGVFGVALSGKIWDSALHCGECLSVVGPNGNRIKAMVTSPHHHSQYLF